MNKATHTQILNQRLISYARAHGCMAYPESGDDRIGVIAELPWYIPLSQSSAQEYASTLSIAIEPSTLPSNSTVCRISSNCLGIVAKAHSFKLKDRGF